MLCNFFVSINYILVVICVNNIIYYYSIELSQK